MFFVHSSAAVALGCLPLGLDSVAAGKTGAIGTAELFTFWDLNL
jgi:hypothetical protein